MSDHLTNYIWFESYKLFGTGPLLDLFAKSLFRSVVKTIWTARVQRECVSWPIRGF